MRCWKKGLGLCVVCVLGSGSCYVGIGFGGSLECLRGVGEGELGTLRRAWVGLEVKACDMMDLDLTCGTREGLGLCCTSGESGVSGCLRGI